MTIHSIRARVVGLVLFAQIVAIAGAVGLSSWYIHRALWIAFDSEMQARITSVLALVGEAEEQPNNLTFDGGEVSIPRGDLFFFIRDAHGHPVAGSSAWLTQDQLAWNNSDARWALQHNALHYRAFVLMRAPILDQENHTIPQLCVDVFYAMPSDLIEARIRESLEAAFGVGLLSLLLSLVSTWWAVTRGLTPLTDFAQQADRIQPDRWQFEEPSRTVQSRELLPLARALQALIRRLHEAVLRERRFLSDAAHELKTTVSIQKSTLQLIEQGRPSGDEYQLGPSRALEDTARTEQLVSNMLLLSSIEHFILAPSKPLGFVRLDESLYGAIEELTSMAQLKSVSLILSLASVQTLHVVADQRELHLLWANLIENAIQYSPPGHSVRIQVRKEHSTKICIAISDEGAGISSEALAHVFERFYRSDASRSRSTGGFGLGLSIAKAIVDKNGGAIDIPHEHDFGIHS